jgi:hypothetical protein
VAKNLAVDDAKSNLTEATFAEHYATWMDLKRKREAAVAKERNALKQAEQAGIPIKAMKEAERRRVDGSDAVEQFEKDMARVGRWMGLPIYTQASLLDNGKLDEPPLPSAAVATEFARQAGYETGKSGGSRTDDNVFPAGTPNHVSWDNGYMAGQAWIAEGLSPKAKKANASKKKPEARSRAALTLVPGATH